MPAPKKNVNARKGEVNRQTLAPHLPINVMEIIKFKANELGISQADFVSNRVKADIPDVDKILSDYQKEPSRITIIITTTDALSGYGAKTTTDVEIETIKRICQYCKQVEVDKQDEFCPVNGHHKMINGWSKEK